MTQRCQTYQLEFPPQKTLKMGTKVRNRDGARKFQEIQGSVRSPQKTGPGNSGQLIVGISFWWLGSFSGEMIMAKVDMLGMGEKSLNLTEND